MHQPCSNGMATRITLVGEASNLGGVNAERLGGFGMMAINFVGCTTGKFAGFTFRMRPA